jgi:leucyl-tRNA synthetase
VEEQVKALAAGELRTGPPSTYNFFDRVFENEMNELIAVGKEAYEKMQFRNALKSCFFDFTNIRDQYRASIQVPLHRYCPTQITYINTHIYTQMIIS